MKVETPSGATYSVQRRWLPWRPHRRPEWLKLIEPGYGESPGRDAFSRLFFNLLLLPLSLVMAFFFVEFLLLSLLLPFFVLSRTVFGRPWVIQVTRERKVVHDEEVKGWGESVQRIERLATALRQGDPW